MKICGGGPEPCCAVTNIGDFDGNGFNEGEIDNYSGMELEGCYNYALSCAESPSDISLTVYHEGSDGGQLDWVEIHTNSHSVRCPIGNSKNIYTIKITGSFFRYLAGRFFECEGCLLCSLIQL